MKKGLKTQEIAKYCMVTNITVRRWIKGGKLAAIRLPSGHYRISVADFRDFLEKYHMPLKEYPFESESEEERR